MIRVNRELADYARRLLETLGYVAVYDPEAPGHCCTDPGRQRRARGSGKARRPPLTRADTAGPPPD